MFEVYISKGVFTTTYPIPPWPCSNLCRVIRRPAAGQPRAVSKMWQVKKPVGAHTKPASKRIHAILST